MGEQTKNLLIGIFVIAACVLIVWLILFLKPTVGDGKETLYVRFADVNKIGVGTRVTYSGQPIGEVVEVQEIQDARQHPVYDAEKRLYFYQLVLKIDSHVKVYNTDEISIQTSGLLGEKSIAITPVAPPKGITPKLVTNQPIYAEAVDPIDHAFSQISNLSNVMQETFSEAGKWIRKNGEDVACAVRSAGNAMEEIKETMHTVNQMHIVADVKTSVQEFTATMQGIQDAIQQLNDGDLFNNACIVMKNLKKASRSIDVITSDIENGTGTLGKLITGDDFYLRMTSTMSKIDTMMNDINHYGILFHLNKTWQRQRAQRATELNALNTPQSFKSYFEAEVSEINTAMSRLSMLIDKAQYNPERKEIFSDDQFQKEFAELLRQADELTNSLKLYNEQLMEAAN